MEIVIPDYHIAPLKDGQFLIKLNNVIVEISNIVMTLPPEDEKKIDNAIFAYDYAIVNGKISGDEELFKKQLNYIVSDEFEKYLNTNE